MRMGRWGMALAAFGSVALAGGPATPTGKGAGADWTYHGADGDETGFSPLAQIGTATVGRLGLAWALDLPGETSLEGTPLAVGGVLYATGAYGKVYAVDGGSGRLLWTHDPAVWRANPGKLALNFAANRGVAYADGRVFLATFDGRLQALDARSGKLEWSVETVPHDSYYFITAAPRVFGNKVVIGNSGGDFGARAFVTAYDAATGSQAWRFWITPGSPEENAGDPVMEAAAKTWSGEFWKTGTGGSAWDNITFDAKYNRIYIPTGNGGPTNAEQRSPGGGDNLFTAAIVALDADTGKYVWHYQYNPRDTWNYDCTQQITLATLTIGGRRRDVLMQAPKNGFFYVIDRQSGKLLSAGKFTKATWAERIDIASGRPVEGRDVRYRNGESTIWPNPVGAHSWQAMAFSPRTGLVYIPTMQNGVHYHKGPPEPGEFNDFGVSIGSFKADPRDGKGALVAWDPVRQQARWRVQNPTLLNGGTLATGGNLVFQGSADGWFSAYDANTGKRLWRFPAGLGIIAPPIAYAVRGRQYVSVLVGYGGSASVGSDVMDVGWKWGAPRRLLTFALGGKAVLPAGAAPSFRVKALDEPGLQLAPADVEAGRGLYMQCVVCHGRDLNPAGGVAPDLRESPVTLDAGAFWSVVHDGALLPRGMPRFDQLTGEQARQIRAYIRAGARQALK
ncbi:MAG: PQQ-dependent dehydrogenase, methanol/ethanol family [Sphingomonadales bacterium]|nr:PQQ-dependent dehydrogenase, methanol/ethanol family [Sphingomonadales bacterium]